MRDVRKALLPAFLGVLTFPAVAAAQNGTGQTQPDHSAAAQIVAGVILIVVTGLAVWFGKRRLALKERKIGVDFAAGTELTKDQWERIPQQQRTAWKKDTDYSETTSPGAKTFTALKDLTKADATIAANTQLSEEDWNLIPEESRATWVKGTDYSETTTPGVKTFTALNDLSAALLLTPGAEIPNDIWKKLTREEKQELRKARFYRYQRGHWFRKLLVGADNRWSTSKFQALMWTYVVVFGLLALMVAKWRGNSNGWDALLKMDTDAWSVYLVLLGGPFAALVLAKLTTSTKADNGTIDKTTAPTSTLDPVRGLGQVLGDDDGTPDLGDTQYFVFNLVAVLYFFGTFAGNLQEGFPELPALLVGLTSVSAATYVTKKAVDRAQPSLKSVVPPTQDVGKPVDVYGSFLVVPSPISPPPADWAPRATVGGIEARVVVVPGSGPTDHLQITIPEGANASAPIVVYTATGTATDHLPFTVRAPEQAP